MRIIFIFISIFFSHHTLAKVSQDEVATLYRSSSLGDHFRFHMATFDSIEETEKGRFDYNWGNCLLVRDVLKNRPGVDIKYWCEKGYFRK